MYKFFKFLPLALIFFSVSCVTNEPKKPTLTENKKGESSPPSPVDSTKKEDIKSKTEVEIIELAKAFIKENKKLYVDQYKMNELKVYKINLNNDQLDDYFIFNSWWANNDGNTSFYYLFDSSEDKISQIKLGNGPKSISGFSKVTSEGEKITANVQLSFVAGDIGNFDQKTTAAFNIVDKKIKFDQVSIAALKKANQKLQLKIDAAYKELEGNTSEEVDPAY